MRSRARWLAIVVGSLAGALACGGSGGSSGDVGAPEPAVAAPAAHQYGSISFKTYRGSEGTIAFKNDTKFEMWWPNIPYAAPAGTYTHEGDDIVLNFDGKSKYVATVLKLRQIDECSIAQFFTEFRDGSTSDSSYVYEQKEPKCKL
jgi:hypothetical protein